MLNEEELAALDGALKLANYCKTREGCEGCPFLNEWGGCGFIGNFPQYWESWIKEIY